MRWLARFVAVLILLAIFVFGVFFTLQNDTLVPLDLLFLQLTPSWLALWVLLAFVLGGVLGVLVGMSAVLRIKKRELSAKRKLISANKELDKLRLDGVKA